MGKIKCTYEDCFKHFDNEKAMIRHKIKEIDHSYCKLCDVDCKDDMLFFIHQLASPDHICALEFKSTGARDTHVATQHRASSNLQCAGCQEKFKTGGALMQHIELDECPVIGLQDFQMQRAERQIQKDAWEAEVDPFGLTKTATDHNSIVNPNTSDDLLDAYARNGPSQSLNNVSQGPGSLLSQAQYPPLVQSDVSQTVNRQAPPQPSIHGAKTSSNLIDLNEPTRAMSALNINQQSWSFQPPPQQPYGNDPRVKNWVNSVNSTVAPPTDNESAVASMYDKKQVNSDHSSTIPPSTQAQPNETAPHQHIVRMPAHTLSMVHSTSRLELDKYFDPIRQTYSCPTTKCKREFRNAEQFREHLLSSNHIGGQVTCPSCLKRFATTAAWVSHTESASKKCAIRNSFNYNHVMREITGGVLGTQGFNDNGSVKFVAPQIDKWNEEGHW